MEIYAPKFILELGVGEYSTSTFFQYDFDKYIGIENDFEWYNLISDRYKEKDKCEFIYHDLGKNIINATFLKELSKEQISNIEQYYIQLSNKLLNNNISPKVLFVDNYTCCRALAINTLYQYFDIIIYHDCEPAAITWYEYCFKKDLIYNYNNYYYKTSGAWTGFFLSNKLEQDIAKIVNVINIQGTEFCQRFKIPISNFGLERKDPC
jgi:hypothetical protein